MTAARSQGGLPYLPPVRCRRWCEYGDGHPELTDRGDQWCGSKQLTIDLHHVQDAADPRNELCDNYLVTHVMQRPGQEPWVDIAFGETNGWKLTVDESVSLALALLDQAERVRRNAGPDDTIAGVRLHERP